jgi:O-antigen/teichoic acid export membrane protein
VKPGIGRAVVHSTTGTAVTRLLGALAGVCVARLLAPAARGDLAILVVIASIASLVGAAGLQLWIARDVARRQGVTSTAVAVTLRHSVAILAGAVVLSGVVLGAAGVGDLALDRWLAAVAFGATGAIAFVWLALPDGARAMGVVATATAAGSALYLAGAIVLLGLDRPSIAAILMLATVGNLATIAVCATYAVRRREATAKPERSVGRTWREGLRFGAAGGAGELVLFGMLRVDFLLVALLLPAREVGIYAVATALTELLWVVPDGTAQIALPSAAGADADLLPAVFRVALTLTVAAGVVLSVLASPVLRVVFGPAYAAGASTVPLLAVAAVAGGAWKMLVSDLAARHTTRDRLVSASVGMATMVAADLVLIPAFGIRGAAGGAALGYVVAGAVILRAWCATTARPARSLVGVRVADFDVLRHRPTVSLGSGGPS